MRRPVCRRAYRTENSVRRRANVSPAPISTNVRRAYPVGVKDGKRGGRATTFVSTADSATCVRLFFRTPGISSRTVSSRARNPAQVSQSTPRSSGKRDRGNAAYGFAPVKRRRRPVTDDGVGTRFVGSLINLPLGRRASAARSAEHANHGDDDSISRRARTSLPRDRLVRLTHQVSAAADASIAVISSAFVVP